MGRSLALVAVLLFLITEMRKGFESLASFLTGQSFPLQTPILIVPGNTERRAHESEHSMSTYSVPAV
jgi:hypothetical protein